MHKHFDLVASCSLSLNLFVPGTVFIFWERHININQTIPLLHCSLEHISVLFLSEMLSSFLLMKIWPSLPGPAWIPFFLHWSRSGKWEMTFFFLLWIRIAGTTYLPIITYLVVESFHKHILLSKFFEEKVRGLGFGFFSGVIPVTENLGGCLKFLDFMANYVCTCCNVVICCSVIYLGNIFSNENKYFRGSKYSSPCCFPKGLIAIYSIPSGIFYFYFILFLSFVTYFSPLYFCNL